MDIREHRLAWRWTDNHYALLPDDVLARLHPVGALEAREIHGRSLSFLGSDALAPAYLSTMMNTQKVSSADGAAWLSQQHPRSQTEISLSWDASTALRTSWAIFVTYWQEFCYPSADDLVVFPSEGNWVLLYHHEEEFHFGVRQDSV